MKYYTKFITFAKPQKKKQLQVLIYTIKCTYALYSVTSIALETRIQNLSEHL